MMEFRNCWLQLFGVIMIIPVAGFAQDQGPKEFSLEKAKNFAVGHGYEVREAQYEVGKAKRDVRATTAIGLPQVEASGNYQHFLEQPVSLIPAEFFGGPPGEFSEVKFGTEYQSTGKLSGNQLLFDGSYFVGLKASQTYQDLSRERLRKTKKELRHSVAKSYFNVLVAEENKRIFEQTLGNIRQSFQETKSMYEEGMTEDQDVDQLELSVLDMENSIKKAERQIQITRKMLKFQMGIPVGDSIALTDSIQQLIDGIDGENLIQQDFNVQSHIDHEMASTQLKVKELTMRNEQMDFLPKFNAFFEHRENAQRDDFNFFDENKDWYPTTIWGVNVSIPIFNSGRKLFQVQKARLDVEKAKVQQEKVSQQLKLQVSNARTDLLNALQRLDNQKKSLQLAQNILDKTMVKYREGMASSLELTQTKNQFLETQGSYIRSVYDVLKANADLKNAMNSN